MIGLSDESVDERILGDAGKAWSKPIDVFVRDVPNVPYVDSPYLAMARHYCPSFDFGRYEPIVEPKEQSKIHTWQLSNIDDIKVVKDEEVFIGSH